MSSFVPYFTRAQPDKFHDALIDMCLEYHKGANIGNTVRAETSIALPLTPIASHMLLTSKVMFIPSPTPGYGLGGKKFRLKFSLPERQKRLQFTKWSYEQGVKDTGRKISPDKAVALQALLGTRAGQALYPQDPYWVANDSGLPTFKRYQRLVLAQMKAAFSGTKADRLKKFKTSEEKLVAQIASEATMPLQEHAAKRQRAHVQGNINPCYNCFRSVGGIDVAHFLEADSDDDDGDD